MKRRVRRRRDARAARVERRRARRYRGRHRRWMQVGALLRYGQDLLREIADGYGVEFPTSSVRVIADATGALSCKMQLRIRVPARVDWVVLDALVGEEPLAPGDRGDPS